MLNDILPENLLVFDIETVPEEKDFTKLNPALQKLWEDKNGRNRPDDETHAQYYFNRAGIFAEFGKVIVIVCGYMQKKNNAYHLKLKTYKGHDEKLLLQEFSQTLINVAKNNFQLCGHNIREFDVPWLCRRMLINGLTLPPSIDLYGKKPWEVNHVDTLDLWKFGDFKHYTSLNLLANILHIPTPKDDMDGSMVGKVYWEEDGLDRIATYCSKDVVAVAQLIMRLKGLPLIADNDIVFAD